ncbi:tape measure protein [Bacillus phage Kirov]|uniref:Tape measure protein n=5 Tax=Viruses TaxID=10239 RepID=A0A7S6RB12_9CAUD|nr:tail length tape measure protein [Bacillus phage Kirov]QOV08246.1 tape measure protein [Bacillus phage Kirov]
MAGSNDLNMILKAQVVKLKVELDAKGSKLPSQVNAISKMLANTPVKLKVKLDTKDITKQIKSINDLVKNKPMKLKVELDTKGTTKQIQDMYKAFNDMNKKYMQQTKKAQEQASKATKQSQSVPTSAPVGNFNNIKQYIKQMQDAEKALRSKFNDGGGIFKSTQFRDAQGNLKGFVAELQRANGVVEKLKYDWNSNSKKFQIIDRQTITDTQKSLAQAEASLNKLKGSINQLKNTDGKIGLLSQFDSLKGKGDSLTKDMVKGLADAVRAEQQLQQQIAQTNKLTAQQAKLLNDIGKARAKDVNNAQLKGLESMAKNGVDKDGKAVADLANHYRQLSREVQVYNETVRKSNADMKASQEVTKQRLQLERELRKLQQQTPANNAGGQAKKAFVDETMAMVRNIATINDMNKAYSQLAIVRNRIGEAKTNAWMDAEQAKSQRLIESLKAVQRQMKDRGMDTAGIDTSLKNYAKNVNTSAVEVERALAKYQRMLTDKKQEIRNAERNLRLGEDISDKYGGADKIKQMNQKLFSGGAPDANTIASIKSYVSAVEGAKVASVSFARDGVDAMGNRMKNVQVTFAGTGEHVRRMNLSFTEGTNVVRQASDEMVRNVNRNLGAWEKLRSMMSSAPMWMLSQAMMTAPIQGLQAMTREILEVDKAMTNIRRVADASLNTDIMFGNAVGLSKELGNNIHDILNGMEEFSRTFGDFNERQLTAITKTATVMSNVSDLKVQDAQASLVGTMNAFNIEAEDSIGIVDKLNQVDNDYAISTQQLATSLQKSASTAKTYGVSLEETIGHTTAIGSVTMESGNIIGNSLKAIYSRITGLQASEGTLKSVGVAMYDMGENGKELRPVGDILNDLGANWGSLTAQQRQNTAVTLAGRNHLTRFLALMNNYPTAIKATVTAYNSQGSAMRENEKYMQSMEAKINQTKNSFTTMSVAFGKAFVSDGIIAVAQGLGLVLNAITQIANAGGGLALVGVAIGAIMTQFGKFSGIQTAVGTFFSKFSEGFRNVQRDGNQTITVMDRMRNGMANTGTATTTVGGAFANAGKSVLSFGLSFGKAVLSMGAFGLAIGAIGWAIEAVIGHFAKLKAEQEAVDRATQKMVDGYRKNMDTVGGLVEKYDAMSKAFASGAIQKGTEEYDQFLIVQSKLAEILPTSVKFIDANGQAWLKNTDEVKKALQMSKELSEAKAREQVAMKDQNLDKATEDIGKLIEAEEKLLQKRKEAEEFRNRPTASQSREEREEAYKKKILDLDVKELQNASKRQEAFQKINHTLTEQARAGLEASGAMAKLGDGAQKAVDNFMKVNTNELNEKIASGAIKGADNIKKAMDNIVKGGQGVGEVFAKEFDRMSAGIDTSTNKGKQKVEELKQAIGKIGSTVPERFMNIENFGGSIDKMQGKLKELLALGMKIQQDGSQGWDGYVAYAEKLGMSANEAKDFVQQLALASENQALKARAGEEANAGYADAVGEGADATGKSADAINKQADAQAKANQKMVEAIDLQKTLYGYKNEEVSAIKGHLESLKMTQLLYGDNATKTEQWGKSVTELSNRFGVSRGEIEQNIDKYYKLADTMGQVKTKIDENGKVVVDYGSMTKDQIATFEAWVGKMRESGEATDIFSGKVDANKFKFDEFGNKLDDTGNKAKTFIDKVKNSTNTLGEVNLSPTIENLNRIKDGFAKTAEESIKGAQGIETNGMRIGNSGTYMNPLMTTFNQLQQSAKQSGDNMSLTAGQYQFGAIKIGQSGTLADPFGLKIQEVGQKTGETATKVGESAGSIEQSAGRIGGAGNNMSPVKEEAKQVGQSFDEAKQKANEGASGVSQATSTMGNAGGNLAPLKENVKQVGTTMGETKTQVETHVGGINTAFGQLGQGMQTGFMSPFKTQAQLFQEQLQGMATQSGTSAQKIGQDVTSIGNAKNALDQYKIAQDAVVQSMGAMGGKAGETATAMQNAGTAIANTVSGFDAFIGKQNELQNAMGQTVSKASEVGNAISTLSNNFGTGVGGAESFGVALFTITNASGTASQAMQQLGNSASLSAVGMGQASEASRASADASSQNANAKSNEANASNISAQASSANANAKQAEANAIMQAINATQQMSQAYGSMAQSAISSISSIIQAIQTYLQAVLSLGTGTMAVANVVRGAFSAMAGSVASSTGAMNSAHNSQASALNKVKDSANQAKSAVQGLNSTIAGAMSSLNNYIAKAQQASNVQVKAPTLPALPTGASWNMSTINNINGAGSSEVASAVASAVSAFSASSGESGTAGGGSGTSGNIIPSIYSGLDSYGKFSLMAIRRDDSFEENDRTDPNRNKKGYVQAEDGSWVRESFYADTKVKSSADDSDKLADAMPWNSWQRSMSELDVTIKWMETKMKNMNKYTAEYRKMMNDVYQVEIKRWELLNHDLWDKERRNEQIKRELEGLKNINSHTKEQRDQYNKLMQEYESNLSSIQSMRAEWQDFLDNWENRYAEILKSHVEAIVEEYTKGLEAIKAKVDDIDFNIEVAKLVDPDNMTKLMNLYIDKANQLKQERAKLENQQRDLTLKLYEAEDRFGKDSQVAKDVKAEIDKVKEAWEDSTLAVLQAEKEIKDTRASVADDGIGQLKDYYGKMKDMALDAIEKEKANLEKAHNEKMKLYDKEIDKINKVYDAKFKEMDKEKSEEDYQNGLNEKNAKRAELQNKISILSRDNSLEGKKKVEELKKELAEVDKELADYQKERQRELMKQALEEQKQAQLDEIENKKTKEQEELDKKVGDLDKQKDDVTKQYDDLLNNDKYWADMRNQFIEGSFKKLADELAKMKQNIDNMNKGIFDGLYSGFNGLSDETKKQIAQDNGLVVDNMDFNSKEPMSNVDELLKAKGYQTFENEVLRPDDPARPMKPAPEPPPPAKPQPPTPQPQMPTKGNVTGVTADSYLNIRNAPNLQGGVVRRILNGANVQILGEDGDWWKVKFSNNRGTTTGYANKKYIKAFDTGGYTGDNVPDEGALALLHKKELVLNKDQTSDILDAVKIMEKVKNVIPALSGNSISSKLATAGSIVNVSYGDVYVTVEGGDKKKADAIAGEIMKGMKKKGR